MKMCVRAILTIAVSGVPVLLFAQDDGGVADGIHSMQSVLDGIYDEMIPLCEKLIDVGRGIAGFAALWYIASRVWRSLANGEPIDFYPLLRPFAICIAIGFFSGVIGLIRGVMEPTVAGTNAMLDDSQKAVATLLQQKEEAVKQTEYWQMYVGETGSGDYDKWYKYTYPGETVDDESWTDVIGNDIKFALAKASYNFRNSVKQWMADVLDILYEAAALCINTIRTFILVILSILGPLVFGLSVFDGFQHTLTGWLARYINIFLWLPVANILGTLLSKIQENMLQIDIDQVQATGDTFFSATDAGYLIFMVIGIVSYFTVPTVANWIVQAGGHNSLLVKSTNMSAAAVGGAASLGATSMTSGGQFIGGQVSKGVQEAGNQMARVGDSFGKMAGAALEGYNEPSTGKGPMAKAGAAYGHLYNKLRGTE